MRITTIVGLEPPCRGKTASLAPPAAAIGREAVYIPRHDTNLWLGENLYALDCATNRMTQLDVALFRYEGEN